MYKRKKTVEKSIITTARFSDRKTMQPIITTSGNKEFIQQNKEFETIPPISFFTKC